MGDRRVGLWLVGALGNVGATLALGVAALRHGLVGATGLVTALSDFANLDLDNPADFVIGGSDIRTGDLATAARAVGGTRPAFAPQLVDACRDDLDRWSKSIGPGCLLNSDPVAVGMADRKDVPRTETVKKSIERLQGDLRSFVAAHKLDQLVVINLASTEPPASDTISDLKPADLHRAIERNELNVLPNSSWMAYAVIDAGYPFVNFTASTGADIPAMAELARQRGVPVAGSDGKTGETLVRTVLAPMFRQRNLRVLSWVGHNVLGNRDGKVLSEPRNRESKLRSKDQVLANLLGYAPQTCTTIEQIDSLDDWKTAWDHVHFQGFLGVPMTMQFTWQGCDSALAAPLVLDLARLTLAAKRHGRGGYIEEMAVFFKRSMGSAPSDLATQFRRLIEFAVTLETSKHRS